MKGKLYFRWVLLATLILLFSTVIANADEIDLILNQMIISKNPQFTGISARQQLEFTTHLLLTD